MLQLQPPRFLPLPRCRIPGSSSRRLARPPALAFRSQWKLPDVDTDAVQERVRSWFSRARGAVVDVTQAARERRKRKEDAEGTKKRRKEEVEEQALVFEVPEITVDRWVGNGWLSMDAVVAIEQFARCVQAWAQELAGGGWWRYMDAGAGQGHPTVPCPRRRPSLTAPASLAHIYVAAA